MSLWDKLTQWMSEDQQQRALMVIPPERVDPTFAASPVVADQDYFRVVVAQMFLQKRSQFFQAYYPAVHSLVRCSFAGGTVEIPNVADPSSTFESDKKGDWIARNFTLLPLMPFKGGEVNITAGLFAVKGENRANDFISVLSGFSKLLAVPQLSTALSIAQPLAAGIQTLFGGGGGMHLGYQNTYVGAGSGAGNTLQQSYIALVRTTADARMTQLRVVNGDLYYGAEPYVATDFMLLRIETRPERDDWNQLTSIAKARNATLDALAAQEPEKAEAQHRQALLAALQAPELTGTDRRRIVDLLKSEYSQLKGTFATSNLTEERRADLQTLIKRSAMKASVARGMGEPTYQEVFGG